jgi:hypothetical protein
LGHLFANAAYFRLMPFNGSQLLDKSLLAGAGISGFGRMMLEFALGV